MKSDDSTHYIKRVILSILLLFQLFTVTRASTTVAPAPFKCWTCASMSLRWNWQITGFATRLNEMLFGRRCQDLMALWEWWDHAGGPGGLQADCTSTCVTWMSERADPAGQISDFVVVRGCLDYLIGDPNIVIPESYCLWGQNRWQAQSTGEEFPVRHLTMFCADELCNTVSSFDDPRCVQQSEENPCFKCTIDGYWTYNCRAIIADPCKGNWCYKRALWMGNTYTEQRGCSPVNPYGPQDTCVYIEEDATLPTRRKRSIDDTNNETSVTTGLETYDPTRADRHKRGITIDYHGYVCYCRDPSGECNVASKNSFCNVVFVIILALVCILVV